MEDSVGGGLEADADAVAVVSIADERRDALPSLIFSFFAADSRDEDFVCLVTRFNRSE